MIENKWTGNAHRVMPWDIVVLELKCHLIIGSIRTHVNFTLYTLIKHEHCSRGRLDRIRYQWLSIHIIVPHRKIDLFFIHFEHTFLRHTSPFYSLLFELDFVEQLNSFHTWINNRLLICVVKFCKHTAIVRQKRNCYTDKHFIRN